MRSNLQAVKAEIDRTIDSLLESFQHVNFTVRSILPHLHNVRDALSDANISLGASDS